MSHQADCSYESPCPPNFPDEGGAARGGRGSGHRLARRMPLWGPLGMGGTLGSPPKSPWREEKPAVSRRAEKLGNFGGTNRASLWGASSATFWAFQSVGNATRTALDSVTTTRTHTWRKRKEKRVRSGTPCPSTARTTTNVSVASPLPLCQCCACSPFSGGTGFLLGSKRGRVSQAAPRGPAAQLWGKGPQSAAPHLEWGSSQLQVLPEFPAGQGKPLDPPSLPQLGLALKGAQPPLLARSSSGGNAPDASPPTKDPPMELQLLSFVRVQQLEVSAWGGGSGRGDCEFPKLAHSRQAIASPSQKLSPPFICH